MWNIFWIELILKLLQNSAPLNRGALDFYFDLNCMMPIIKRRTANILERIFRANTDNVNEYIIASIGLTKADIQDMNIKLSLTGFGYTIKRVNIIPQNKYITIKEETKDAESK